MAGAHRPLPPSPLTTAVSRIEEDIFHNRLFNLIYICSSDHSLGRRALIRAILRSPFLAERKHPLPTLSSPETIPRIRDLGRPRQGRFKDRASGKRYPGSIPRSRDVPLTTAGTTYEQRRECIGRYASSRLSSFLFHFFFFFFFRFFSFRFSFDFIPSVEYRSDESASASRRSLERAETDIACLP